jgi:hypothetical protein
LKWPPGQLDCARHLPVEIRCSLGSRHKRSLQVKYVGTTVLESVSTLNMAISSALEPLHSSFALPKELSGPSKLAAKKFRKSGEEVHSSIFPVIPDLAPTKRKVSFWKCDVSPIAAPVGASDEESFRRICLIDSDRCKDRRLQSKCCTAPNG